MTSMGSVCIVDPANGVKNNYFRVIFDYLFLSVYSFYWLTLYF